MLRAMMGESPLLLKMIAEFGERHNPKVEIVSVTKDNPLHRYTFADAFRRAKQLANGLARLGCRQEDRVATLAWNDYRHFEAYYAISCSGLVCHTINPRLFPLQIEHIINHAEDRFLLADPNFLPLLERVLPQCPGVRGIIVMTSEERMVRTSLANVICYETLIGEQSDEFAWPLLDENAAAALCYTSGTTGEPKGVLYSHRSMVLHSMAAALPDTFNLSARDCVLPAVPMFHVHAWGIPYTAVMTGSKLVLPGQKLSDGAVLSSLMNGEGVTVAAGVPTIWLGLLSYLEEHGKTLSTVERLVVGGSACPPILIEEFRKRLGIHVYHSWGMTETGPLGLFNSSLPGQEKLDDRERLAVRAKQGRGVFGVEIKITDDQGNELPWDGRTSGMLKVRGPWVCSNYFGMAPGESEAHDARGWFTTGDVATIDAQGYVQLTDRAKDMIKSGGEWISSIELEHIAMHHPAVEEAAVIAVAHHYWAERPLLVVRKRTGAELSREEMLAWFEGKIARWWMPDDVAFIDAALPKTATGKLNKLGLREDFNDYCFPDEGYKARSS